MAKVRMMRCYGCGQEIEMWLAPNGQCPGCTEIREWEEAQASRPCRTCAGVGSVERGYGNQTEACPDCNPDPDDNRYD